MKKTIFISSLILLLTFSFNCAGTGQKETPSQPITDNQMKTSPQKGDTVAKIKTNFGNIKILLYTDKAPETAKNFIELSKAGKYDNNIFHRVIKDFMIQGGDFENRNGTGGYSYKGPGTTIEDEFGEGLSHIYGAVSMANAGPDTGGSQFFIVQNKEGTKRLDGKHSIFGYVFEGMDNVEKIAGLKTDQRDRPLEDVIIETIEIDEF
ncbi:peptidylprolyl isomerase [Candidatus Peregrinibacteria bacterium]|nr:peptidylprolyl isomerase [Candidatus Peregrinibacteria bacterium]